MTALEQFWKTHRHRIPLSDSEILLLTYALRDYKNSELTKEIWDLKKRLENILRRKKQ